MDPRTYLDTIRLKLATSPIIAEAEVVQERRLEDQGFFRARLQLANEDFVEVAEFFVVHQGRVQTVEYRYQWMDSTKQHLRKRWDNAAHYPGLPGFPHHVHIGAEDRIEPGESMRIVELIELLERETGGIS